MKDESPDCTATLSCGGSTVSVRPDRGALVSRLRVDGVEVLYLDEATLELPSGAVRGGVPLLFPFAGELPNGRLVATGTDMPRHGFGRRKAWQVTGRTASAITMRLAPDADTRRHYPFEFDVAQVVTATPRGVRIDLHVENRDAQPLPIAPGWHPYFPCPAAQKLACLRQMLTESDLSSLDPVACDVNLQAPDARMDFDLPDLGRVSLTFCKALKTLEVWTLPEQDFVCIEPWVGPSNTINTPDRVTVAPGGRALFWMAIELLDPGARRRA
jgi:galactose mutarotase-like enzyme